MNESFSEETLELYSRLVAEKLSADFSEGETYDFARCMRPDGTFYGTRGKCRQGSEAGPAEKKEGTSARGAGEGAAAARAGGAQATAGRRGRNPEMKAKDNELRSEITSRMVQQKERKAELDRLERAFKVQEKKTKEDSSRENKDLLRRVRTALIQQVRLYDKGQREIERMAAERLRIQKKMQRARMSPAQLAAERRIAKIIKERG